METFQAIIEQKLRAALDRSGLAAAGEVTPAADARFGDYQTNAAMVLAKQRSENPRALAQKIVSVLDLADVAEPPQIAGPGFINFTIKNEALVAKALEVLRDER